MAGTLCFIPCSKSKTKCSSRKSIPPILTKARVPETWGNLQGARRKLSAHIEEDSRSCSALRHYNGHFYKSEPNFRAELERHLRAGWLDTYIVSAGYGVIHALDPIQAYGAEMKGAAARQWRDMGLVDVISELIRVSLAVRVFGFFAGPSHWNGAHAKYRYFFTEGIKSAIAHGAKVNAAICFFRETGRGSSAINRALGRTLLRGLRSNFSANYLREHTMGRSDGNILIRSEIIYDITDRTKWQGG